jgi:hypothetical protein
MQMQLGIDSQIPDGLLAANALLAENSRQGVPTSTHTLHRGFEFAISSTVLGLEFQCYESASDPVVAPNKMTPAQCAAANTVLAREAQYGTPKAARMSGNTFGDGTLQPFNSTFVPNLQSPVGQIDLDWFTDVSGYGGGQYTNALVYTIAKTGWTISRLMSGASIGHYAPYADPGERNAVWQSTIGTQYADIFTPQFMQQACGGH